MNKEFDIYNPNSLDYGSREPEPVKDLIDIFQEVEEDFNKGIIDENTWLWYNEDDIIESEQWKYIPSSFYPNTEGIIRSECYVESIGKDLDSAIMFVENNFPEHLYKKVCLEIISNLEKKRVTYSQSHLISLGLRDGDTYYISYLSSGGRIIVNPYSFAVLLLSVWRNKDFTDDFERILWGFGFNGGEIIRLVSRTSETCPWMNKGRA